MHVHLNFFNWLHLSIHRELLRGAGVLAWLRFPPELSSILHITFGNNSLKTRLVPVVQPFLVSVLGSFRLS